MEFFHFPLSGSVVAVNVFGMISLFFSFRFWLWEDNVCKLPSDPS